MWNCYIPTERKPGQQSKINILIQKNWKPTPVGPLPPSHKKIRCTDKQCSQQSKRWLTHTHMSVTFAQFMWRGGIVASEEPFTLQGLASVM